MFDYLKTRFGMSGEARRRRRLDAHMAAMAKIDATKVHKALTAEFCTGASSRFWIWPSGKTSFTLCVDTDDQIRDLSASEDVQARYQTILRAHGYPANLRKTLRLSFMSQETITRDYQGSWYYWYK